MLREEAITILKDLWRYEHTDYTDKEVRNALDMAIKALEQEPCREQDDYENEIEDLHNRLDIAEYDKERLREEVTNLETQIKALEQEPCEDAVSRQAVLDLIDADWKYEGLETDIVSLPPVQPKTDTDCISRAELLKAIDTWDKFGLDDTNHLFRLDNLSLPHYVPYIHYDDVIKCIKGMPSVTPQESKTGHWIDREIYDADRWKCSECGRTEPYKENYCPKCGADMRGEQHD